jgi:hypothetical protein
MVALIGHFYVWMFYFAPGDLLIYVKEKAHFSPTAGLGIAAGYAGTTGMAGTMVHRWRLRDLYR